MIIVLRRFYAIIRIVGCLIVSSFQSIIVHQQILAVTTSFWDFVPLWGPIIFGYIFICFIIRCLTFNRSPLLKETILSIINFKLGDE